MDKLEEYYRRAEARQAEAYELIAQQDAAWAVMREKMRTARIVRYR